jgi:hypothetical protein
MVEFPRTPPEVNLARCTITFRVKSPETSRFSKNGRNSMMKTTIAWHSDLDFEEDELIGKIITPNTNKGV